MIEWTKIIENDDLENFKIHFDIKNWKSPITQIENYADITKNTPTISYNDADVLKYALHCESDKIFNYLLPQLDPDKHGEDYGWPLLGMALKKGRYDYANDIIKHDKFDPYQIYHINSFEYIDSYKDANEHIKFLFNYLENFNIWDFKLKNKSFIYRMVHLICYNEECFENFQNYYQKTMNNNNLSVLDLYKENMDILAEEILYDNYRKFLLDKLSSDNYKEMLEQSKGNKILLSKAVEGDNQIEVFKYLLKAPEQLLNYLYDNLVLFSYLSLDSVLLLEQKIDFWKTPNIENTLAPIDFIMHPENKNQDVIMYFVNNYPHKIIDKFKGEKEYIVEMCEKKLLEMKLEGELIPKVNHKKTKI